MTLRQLWAKHRVSLYQFQTLQRNSNLYQYLVSSGVQRSDLDDYINSGRGRKRPNSAPSSFQVTDNQLDGLLAMGGSVAGGAALRSWLYLDEARDFDVFFPNIVSFVKAHLAVYDNPLIDICLYEQTPYELFDLAASKCAYSSSGFSLSSSFEEAMDTGVSDIELEAIVHPLATLRRVIKYGNKYNLKFPRQKILVLATTDSIDKNVVQKALDYSV